MSDIDPSSGPQGGASATPPGQRPRPWRRRLLLGATAVGLLGAGAVAASLAWAWRSEAGAQWLMQQVPGLEVQALNGALGGPRLSARQLRLRLASGTLDLSEVRLEGLQWQWRPHRQAWLGLQVDALNIGRLRWTSAPSTTPTTAPADLEAPVMLTLRQLAVAALEVDQAPAMQGLLASATFGAQQGRQHLLTVRSLRTDRLSLSGEWQVQAQAPMQVQSRWQARSLDGLLPSWQAELGAQGPLSQLQLQAELQGQTRPGGPAVHAQAQAECRPFANWPLRSLALRTQSLDLASLHSQWPSTELSGTVSLAPGSSQAPMTAELSLNNAQPGQWDRGALPLQALRLAAEGHWQTSAQGQVQLDPLRLSEFDLRLGNGRQAGGRVQGQGLWQGLGDPTGHTELKLQLTLQGLLPAVLDQRLPATRVSGPVNVSLGGLPPPDRWRDTKALPPAPSWQLGAQLRGQWLTDGQAPEAALLLQASGEGRQATLAQFEARAGGALATAQGQLRWPEVGPLQWQGQAELRAFDPSVWWPGEPGGAWRRGPHRLNARLDTQAQLPLAALQAAGERPLGLLEAWQGRLHLSVSDSLLAGVALNAQADLDGTALGHLKAWVDADGNRLDLSAQGPASERTLRAVAKAPALARLAPWVGWMADNKAWAPTAGALDGDWRADRLTTGWQWQGSSQLSGLRTAELQLDQASWSGQGGDSAAAPLQLQVTAKGLRQGQARVDQLSASLMGSAQRHQIQLQLDSPVRAPAWLEQVLGIRAGSSTRFKAQAEGHWIPAASANGSWPVGQWQAQLSELLGGAADGSGQPWLAGRDLSLLLSVEPGAELAMVELQPGQLQLPGTQLQWQTARWQAAHGGQGPQLALDAKIAPFALAPLLARAQPELGWQGDLTLGGEVRVRRAERFDADFVFERRSGDLSVSEDVHTPDSRQMPMGLSDLRLALSAHDGQWQFTQALAGRQMGEMAGALQVQARPEALWPSAQAPMSGVLQARVANLGAWGAWVPAGWRLGGELRTLVQIGGSLGAPELTGQVTGEGLGARNTLMGVQLSDGQVRVQLDGTRARVETLQFKAGDGRLGVTGEASLGASPQARLKLNAERFQVLGRVDRRVVASGDATVLLERENLSVDAQIRIDEGLIDFSHGDAPGLDDDVSLVQSAESSPASPQAKGGRGLRLSSRVDLGQKLHLKGRGLDAYLRGDLKVAGQGGKLSVNGTVRAENGTYAAYGQKLDIERGEIQFKGPLEDPGLDIFAVRPNLDVQVGVAITGSALNPRVRLASEPEMTDAYKLSWLMLGREPDGLGEADTALLQRAALALLAGEGEAPTDALFKTLGITDFGLHQTTDSNDVRQTVVSLGKQLSRRWYVGYERGVNATTGTWQLIYRAAQRFTLRAQSGEDNALDLIWTWRWQ